MRISNPTGDIRIQTRLTGKNLAHVFQEVYVPFGAGETQETHVVCCGGGCHIPRMATAESGTIMGCHVFCFLSENPYGT